MPGSIICPTYPATVRNADAKASASFLAVTALASKTSEKCPLKSSFAEATYEAREPDCSSTLDAADSNTDCTASATA